MSMNLGVIGPQQSVWEVEQAVDSMHIPVTITPLIYNDYTETLRIVSENQGKLDAVLFTGTLPFEYAVHYIHPECPWSFPPRDMLSLVFTLLKAGFLKEYDITRVTFDSIDRRMVYDAYHELGYTPSDIKVLFAAHSLFSPKYVEKLFQFHKEHIERGETHCAITGVDKVYRLLRKAGLPCMMNSKSSDSIIRAVKYLLLSHKLDHIGTESTATVAISVEYLEEHPVYDRSVLQLLRLKSQIRDRVYVFAQSIDAAVYEEGESSFYLVAQKSSMTHETEQLSYLPLLQEISKIDLVRHVYAGVGLALQPAHSKRSAELALRRARTYGASCMYVCWEDMSLDGPIVEAARPKTEKEPLERNLTEIARRSGVSARAISRLDSLIRQYGIEYTTSKQLAQLYGGSVRNFQRMLTKLMDAGYVQVIGKEVSNKAGRPSRIVQIDFGLE